jgi:transposase
MSRKKRRKHSKEFKEEAVKLVTEEGYQVSEAARNLGIHANVLGRWKRELTGVEGRNGSSGDVAAMEAELKRLRKENQRLQMEREILKKAAAFFANESD